MTTKAMRKDQARKWLDDHGHNAIPLPRKWHAVLNVPPIYMEKAGIDTTWTLTAVGNGLFILEGKA